MRQIYDMIDGVPIWKHLKGGVTENKIKLIGPDYGKFAEILGKRVLDKLTDRGGILVDIFPEIEIVSVQTSPRVRILTNAKIELGDLVLEISYKNCSGEFGKKVVIFEIKHGHFQIQQNQLRRYCLMINSPGEYFPKADEVKVIFMMFDRINTNKGSASYYMSELGKDLVTKILENSPVPITDLGSTDTNIIEGLKTITEECIEE